MFGLPVTDKNKKLISEMFSKKIYMYENDKGPVRVFDKQKDLLKEMAMSSKTLIKYKDSGLLFRSKYLLFSCLKKILLPMFKSFSLKACLIFNHDTSCKNNWNRISL